MEHHKITGMIIFNDVEQAAMPNVQEVIGEIEIPAVLNVIEKLIDSCINEEFIPVNLSNEQNEQKAEIYSKLKTLIDVNDCLEKINAHNQIGTYTQTRIV